MSVKSTLGEKNTLLWVNQLQQEYDKMSKGGEGEDLGEKINALVEVGQRHMLGLEKTEEHERVIPIHTASRLIEIFRSQYLQTEDVLLLPLSKVCRLFSEIVCFRQFTRGRGVIPETRTTAMTRLKEVRKAIPQDQVMIRYNIKCSIAAWELTQSGAEIAKDYIKSEWKDIATAVFTLSPVRLLKSMAKAIRLAHVEKNLAWFTDAFRLHRRSIFIFKKKKIEIGNLYDNLHKGWKKDGKIAAFAGWRKDDRIALGAVEALGMLFLNSPDKKVRELALEGGTKEIKGIEVQMPGLRSFSSFTASRIGKGKEPGWKVRYRVTEILIERLWQIKNTKETKTLKKEKKTCFAILKVRLFDPKKIKEVDKNKRVKSLLFDYYLETRKQFSWGITKGQLDSVKSKDLLNKNKNSPTLEAIRKKLVVYKTPPSGESSSAKKKFNREKAELERQEKELLDEDALSDVFNDLDMLLLREKSIEEEKSGETND